MEHKSGMTLPFTGRTEEMKQVKDQLGKPGFSLITARRGMGRTAFLRELANSYSGNKQYKVFYADLSDAVSPATFILSLARQTLAVPEANQVKQLRELSNYFTYLRPVINFNRISGAQQLEFSLDDQYKAAYTLEQLFTYLSRQAAKVIVLLDDFHQVQHFRDDKFSGFISEVLKQNSELRILAAVAESKRWNTWINDSGNGFLKDAPSCSLDAMEHEEMRTALIQWFKSQGKKLTDEVADYLLEWSRLNTSLTVKVSSLLLQSEPRQPDNWFLENMLLEYLGSQRDIYLTYRRLLTSNQWLLLRGIARERGAKLVMGGEFVRKYVLGSASSVQTALDALYDKEMVFEEDGRLYLEDISLSRWMEI